MEEMDAAEFRRYANTLPEAERAEVRRARNAWRFRRWYETSERSPSARRDARRGAARSEATRTAAMEGEAASAQGGQVNCASCEREALPEYDLCIVHYRESLGLDPAEDPAEDERKATHHTCVARRRDGSPCRSRARKKNDPVAEGTLTLTRRMLHVRD